MCMHCSRRQFLGAGAVGGMALGSGALVAGDGPVDEKRQRNGKVRICVVIAGNADDRSWCLSPDEVQKVKAGLDAAEKKLGNVEFVSGEVTTADQTAHLLAQAGPEAPVLAVSADIFGLRQAVAPVVFEQRRPTAVFHLPVVGGHDWCLVKPWREAGHRITLFNSSDYGELERAAALLRVIPLLRQSRVLASPPLKGTPESQKPELVKQRLGAEMVGIPDGDYDKAMDSVDNAAASSAAEQWLGEAQKVVEPARQDVVQAARASLTLDRLITDHDAQALCVGTCMSWLDRGFPCLGFSRLNDRGIPAACDGDMDCVLTMLMFQHALDQPGFLGNAAGADTARDTFHLSHCSAPLKMDGPHGPKAPYLLRRHAEVRGGAVPEVHYRLGQMVTFTKLIHLNTLLMFTGRIVEVPAVPPGEQRGCRTEIVVKINDAERLLANWGGGALGESATDYYASLHRVAYYGDHTSSIRHLGHLLGLNVVAEV